MKVSSTTSIFMLVLIDVKGIIQLIHAGESASYNFIHGPPSEQIQTHLLIVHCTFPTFFDRRKL